MTGTCQEFSCRMDYKDLIWIVVHCCYGECEDVSWLPVHLPFKGHRCSYYISCWPPWDLKSDLCVSNWFTEQLQSITCPIFLIGNDYAIIQFLSPCVSLSVSRHDKCIVFKWVVRVKWCTVSLTQYFLEMRKRPT